MIEAIAPYTFPERLLESIHPWSTQLNEALNHIVAKYAPKDRTYSTTMSLQNRISIVVGIHNCGHLEFWTEVFSNLRMNVNKDLVNNLSQQDNTKERKRKHNEKRETKIKRRRIQNEKMKDMMQKQKLDEIRGKTYQSGEAMRHLIPNEVLKIEEDIKLKGNINCGLWGCNHEKKHKTSKSKHCRYFTYKDAKSLTTAVDSRMRCVYPHHYGEFFTEK